MLIAATYIFSIDYPGRLVFFRPSGRVHFLCLPKENRTKRNGTRDTRPSGSLCYS